MLDSQQEVQGLSEDIQNSTEDQNPNVEQDASTKDETDEIVDNHDVTDDLVEQDDTKSNDKVKKIKRVVRSLDKRNRLLEEQLAQQQQFINAVMGAAQNPQQLQQQLQQQVHQPVDFYNSQQFDPYTGMPVQQQPDVYELAKKAAEEHLLKKEQEQKTNNFIAIEESLRDKYDDYEDFTSEVRPFLTKEMLLALRELPSTSLEALYKAWGENSAEVKRISKLPAFQQYLAVAKLDERYSTKSNQQQVNQPVASKKVIPPLNVKPSTNVKKSTYVEMLKNMK